jgi:hypothetical protein
MLRSFAVWVVLAATFHALPAGALTADQLQERIARLEERVRDLENALAEKDRELDRLRQGQLGPGPGGPGTPNLPLGRHLDEMDQLIERMRRQFGLGPQDFGLPGPQANPPTGPLQLFPGGPRGGKGGYLGIQIGEHPDGVLVDDVVPGSAAMKAGMLRGDVIVKIEGAVVSTPADVVSRVGQHAPGETIEVTVKRGGGEQTLRATLGNRNDTFGNWQPTVPNVPRFQGPFGGPQQPNLPAANGMMSLEIETDAGTATVKFSAAGLYVSDEDAKKIGLDEAKRDAVENAYADARDELARNVVQFVKDGGERAGTREIVRMLRDAEAGALEKLGAILNPAEIAELRRIQEEASTQNSVSVSRKSKPGPVGPKGNLQVDPLDDGAEF